MLLPPSPPALQVNSLCSQEPICTYMHLYVHDFESPFAKSLRILRNHKAGCFLKDSFSFNPHDSKDDIEKQCPQLVAWSSSLKETKMESVRL